MPTSAAAQLNDLAPLFDQIRVGDVIDRGPVTFVPLFFGERAPTVDADLLEEGVRAGVTTVSEINEAGSVQSILVEHRGKFPLLIIDGEQVVGAKQNRVFNASFLVPPGASVVVPVSCVERGRWEYQARPHAHPGDRHSISEFAPSEVTVTGDLRSRKLARVARSAMTSRRYDADQREVWRDVDEYLAKTKIWSPTSSFHDGFTARADEVDAAMESLHPQQDQAGIAAVAGTRLISLDMFGSPRLYRRAWKKVVRGVLADVYTTSGRREDAKTIVEAAIRASRRLQLHKLRAPGTGETLHGAADGLAVGAIALDGLVYHAVVAAA
jgi:hypothetical protein